MLKSKLQGDEVEDELLEYLQGIGLSVEKNKDYSNRYAYDLSAEIPISLCEVSKSLGFKLTFEAKNDIMAKRTGNVAVEYHNSKKNEPSGISRTSATFWAHKIDGTIWIVSVQKLKEFIEVAQPFKVIESGGDKNANLLIYKIDHFTSICKPLEEFKNASDFISVV